MNTTTGMFNGSDYDPTFDEIRLTSQHNRVFNVMKDGQWRTLDEINTITKDPHASISAQLRHMRKKRFGSHTIEKKVVGDREDGLYAYRLIENKETNSEEIKPKTKQKEPRIDTECICKGNWRAIISESTPFFDRKYLNHGVEYTFAGVLHSELDFYYLMISEKDATTRRLCCVGSIEAYDFILQPE